MRYKKGQSGNPAGRPVGSLSIYKRLENAIAVVEKEKSMDIYKHFIERALESDSVLTALFKKLIPDRQQVEGDVARIINIINGYRNSNKSRDNALREEPTRTSVSTAIDATESS